MISTTSRYARPVRPYSQIKCLCGCGARATQLGEFKGCVLAMGCEQAIDRWVKTGSILAAKSPKAPSAT